MSNYALLFGGMLFILVAAMVFCNALEHLGEQLGISEGVTGSIFVAVGTALPEAIIPLIAFFAPHTASTAANSFDEVGIGAILGPPLMLSTLSITLMAFSVLWQRGLNGQINPEPTGFRRDLNFFSLGYLLAIVLAVSHNYYINPILDLLVVAILFFSYFIYVLLTVRASSDLVAAGHGTEAEAALYATRYLKLPTKLLIVLGQALAGFAGLVYFAHLFIIGINGVAYDLGLSPFLLSVVLIPVATELPEKVNSILWIRKGKDTLAMGNITGAMVFQGLLLPIMGILLTEWTMPLNKGISCIATFMAVAWLYFASANGKPLRISHFIVNGGLYIFSLMLSMMVVR